MISYFPTAYPDELVYSLLSRFYTQSGYLSYTYAAEDIYAYKQVRPDHYFVNTLHPEMREMMERIMPMEELIKKHTMYPYYGRFMPTLRRRRAFDSLVTLNGNYSNLLVMPNKRDWTERYLRYCPVCALENRDQYGETYWNRNHQLMGINICPKHKCYLANSSVVISGKASPNLTAAEVVVPESEDVLPCNNPLELRFAEYAIDVFQAPVDLDNDVPVGQFLHLSLGKKYVTDSGLFRNLTEFYEDYLKFYDGIKGKNRMELYQVQKIFNGYRFNANEICELAMLLNIPPEELVKMELPEGTHPLDTLYKRVAKELDVDYDMVISIGDAVLKAYKTNQRVRQKCGPREKQWNKLDEELLPKVREVIEELVGGGVERPRKVTTYAIRRKLNLPDKQLEKLPLCIAEIAKHEESQQQYWAREVVWATKTVIRSGQPLNWRQIRNLTNMRRVNFLACLSYLDGMAGEELVEIIRGL